MKLMQRLKYRNLAFNVTAGILAASLATHSLAAPDYDRIRKDINVMIGIVKSAFNDNESCDGCSVRISGHYLADQGVVFNVDPSSARFVYKFREGDDLEVISSDVIAGIPGMVGTIIEEVRATVDDMDHYEWEWDDQGGWTGINREARDSLRESRRELRELARELREVEIEAIHAEHEELEALRNREQEIEQRMAEAEQRRAEVEKKLQSHARKAREEQESRRAKIREKRQQKFADMENLVLNTFCDYSRTMRSIPKGEKVSVIINRNDDDSNVYIFDQNDLESCDSGKTDVRKHALSYPF